MIRVEFTKTTLKARFEYSGGQCEGVNENGERCPNMFSVSNPPEGDHHVEAWEGGDNSFENCRMLGKKCCHKKKTAAATTHRAKADRQSHENRWVTPKKKWLSRKFASYQRNADPD